MSCFHFWPTVCAVVSGIAFYKLAIGVFDLAWVLAVRWRAERWRNDS